jgi:hypothetical protein
MAGDMADYRLFCFDRTGNLVLSDWVSAETDEAAVTAARNATEADRIEVWRRDHLVATLLGGRAIFGEPRPII